MKSNGPKRCNDQVSIFPYNVEREAKNVARKNDSKYISSGVYIGYSLVKKNYVYCIMLYHTYICYGKGVWGITSIKDEELTR